jgi:hypothetical protein
MTQQPVRQQEISSKIFDQSNLSTTVTDAVFNFSSVTYAPLLTSLPTILPTETLTNSSLNMNFTVTPILHFSTAKNETYSVEKNNSLGEKSLLLTSVTRVQLLFALSFLFIFVLLLGFFLILKKNRATAALANTNSDIELREIRHSMCDLPISFDNVSYFGLPQPDIEPINLATFGPYHSLPSGSNELPNIVCVEMTNLSRASSMSSIGRNVLETAMEAEERNIETEM